MPNKFKKYAISSIFIIGLLYLTSLVYTMSKMTVEEIISCSSDDAGFYIDSHICETYMKQFKTSPSDIEELSYGGVEVILNLESDKKYEIAEFYISKGLNVDRINQYQSQFGSDFSPIHTAIFDNDLKKVNFLILNNANLMIKSQSAADLKPLEYAIYLQEKDSSIDRSKVIERLSEVIEHITSN